MDNSEYLSLLNEGQSNQGQQVPTTIIQNPDTRVQELISIIQSQRADLTADYNDWIKLGFALANEFGESGRRDFHTLSSYNPNYQTTECDKKYDECLKSDKGQTGIATLFYLAEQHGITLPKVQQNYSHPLPQIQNNTTSDKNVALSFVETNEEDRSLPLFEKSIYNHLPLLLHKAVTQMNTAQEKDLILIGSIATLSCALLPFRTTYNGRTIFPNIFLFVPGQAGSGKGRLDFCYRLVRPIHIEKRDLWEFAKQTYKQELERYRNLSKKDKALAEAPTKPPITLLRVPANCSATSFAEAMADNGNMLMFETEGDTVVNTFKSDYGNYSDNFRKAFAHEEFGYLRRGNDNEEREVTNPRLSVVLSGTPEQVKSLIPNAENGLLSRFIFYCMSSTDEWIDGFSGYDSDNPLEKTFDQLGQDFLRYYKDLQSYPEINFSLSIVQQQKFNDYFRAEKQKMKELNGNAYTANSHRLAWATLRIAMILTALRMMDSERINTSIECSDNDFDTALSITKTISAHNDYIFNVLNDTGSTEVKVSETYSSAARVALLSLLPSYFTSKDMKEAATKIGKSLRTIERQIRRAIDKGQVEEISRGNYRKK